MAFNDVNEAIKTVEMRTFEREKQTVIYNRDAIRTHWWGIYSLTFK